MNIQIDYNELEEIACGYLGILPVLSSFELLERKDGAVYVEVGEVGKTPKTLKITVNIEEL